MSKIKVGNLEDFPPGSINKVELENKEILITNVEGKLYATDDTCTHSGASLSEGKLEGTEIICGWHGAKFDCRDGKLLKFPAQIKDLQVYKVSTESKDVFIEG